MTEPTSIVSDGNTKIVFVSAVADTSAPTVAEATGGTDITEYVTGDGFDHSIEQATIADDRVSTTQSLQRPGRITDTLNLGIEGRYAEEKISQTVFSFAEGDPRPAIAMLHDAHFAQSPTLTFCYSCHT